VSPRISVVIPTYNRARTLVRALDSVFAQGVPDLEVIVVDDGSGDDTKGTIARYPHPVTYLEQANAGPAAARNRALAVARGEFIAFLDSDDVYLPRHLEAHLEVFARSPETGLVHGASEVVDVQGTVVKVQRPTPGHRGRVLPALLFHNFVTLSAVVMRRACYEQVGPMHETLRFAEDWLYWLRIAAHVPFDYVEEVTLRFERSVVSATRRPLPDLAAENRAMLDLAFADPSLGPQIARHRAAAYAGMYRGYAKMALEGFRPAEARRFLGEALRSQPADPESLVLMAKTFLPEGWVRTARAWARGGG
jgi:glycosyltransferase involved in cell wall biosynthesis